MSDAVIPAILLMILLCGVIRRAPVYDAFLIGAKAGLKTAASILPCLCAMLLAVSLLSAAGALEALLVFCSPALRFLGVPEGALPVLLMRPFSGSAALAVLERTLAQYGADSAAGRCASVMMGSSETIFYTMTLYLGAAGVKRAPRALPAALLAWLAGGLASAWFTNWM